jgi:nucleotide-binding universal stress UspA family protein
MIRRILVGLGNEEHADSATKTAIGLARIHQAELTGMTVLDVNRLGATGPVPIGAGEAASELREHRITEAQKTIQEILDNFVAACELADVPYRVERDEGDPFAFFEDQTRYHDLVLCGLGHLFEHGVIDEPPAELVRLVQAGVRPLITVQVQHREIQRVLIAYSGSMESAKAMKRFVQMHLWPDVVLHIVTFEDAHGEPEQLLQNAARYCESHGYQVDTNYINENAYVNLLSYAEQWNADLIVMGNSNRNLLLRRIFGETMLHVVQNTDRPLFLSQ